MNKYGFHIVWSDEDEGYVATSPEFPGLTAFGATQEEALSEAKIAQDLFVHDMRERGEELPAPLAVSAEYSGQTRLRLPKSVHRIAAELAAAEGVSLNQFFVDAISQRIGAVKGSQQMLAELRKLFAQDARQRQTDIASIALQHVQGTESQRVVRTTLTQMSTETTRYIDPKGH